MMPEYQYYSLEELEDAKLHIDASAYPDRYEAILSELHRRRAGVDAQKRRKVCLSCAGPLVREKVKPYQGKAIYAIGVFSDALFWLLSALTIVLLATSFWVAAIVAGATAFVAPLLLLQRVVDGYCCQDCEAQYAPWQIEN